MIELPIEDDGRRISHLAVDLERPERAPRGGVCVLYLHGFASSQGGDKAMFFRRHFLPFGVAFCSFDFQGHGASGGDLLDLTLSRNLADVGRVHGYLRSEGFERFVLMGSSMGGGTALWYAALHPDDFVAAVHIAPAVEMEKGLLRRVGPDGEALWRREGRLSLAHARGKSPVGWQLIEDLRAFERDRLATLYRIPTLLFQGRHDDAVDWRAVVDFAAACRGEAVTVYLMMDGDHRLVDRLDTLWRTTAAYLEDRL